MNKEIEELLNNIKDKYSYEPYDTTGKIYTTISYEEGQLLLSYIEQLEKELKEEQEDNYKQSQLLVEKQQKIEQLEKNRDKAIEYNKNILKENWYGGYEKENAQKNIDILKGGSE